MTTPKDKISPLNAALIDRYQTTIRAVHKLPEDSIPFHWEDASPGLDRSSLFMIFDTHLHYRVIKTENDRWDLYFGHAIQRHEAVFEKDRFLSSFDSEAKAKSFAEREAKKHA